MNQQTLNRFQQLIKLVRAKEWWSYKLAPVLGTAYATAAILNISLISLWSTLLFLLFALVIGASYASLINNICDQEEDQISGKANYFIGRSKFLIALAMIGCIVLGLIVSGLLIQVPLALCFYIGNWLLFTVYSVPPIRLKNRGIWGGLAIAMGESLVPQILSIFLIAHNTDKPLSATWLTMIAIWAFALGLRSILWHQILDFENDHLAGINTFAVNTSKQTLQRLGKWVVFPIEFLSLLVILLLSNNVFGWIFIGIYFFTEFLRYYFWKLSIVIIEPTNKHRLFLFEYYDVFYPLSFLALSSCQDPTNLIILGFHLLFYYSRIWWWMKDFWGLLRWEIPNKFRNHNSHVKL
ncbi:UbiA family prenyltransferase [Anabaena cylindrica FACHB-243]|uniref:UbiA prenyltransferase n=1 Tax=Anabaena cylindrica (strain ATCC 27899 / PCC 7122) TaxID=272123 RepID=K9ZL44_ANACC|nr:MULTISPECIES: UbiA family prenyltransferase [Anabaena]AFZ59055.1 UbiA prenyltransferase [Anabaena cylindrica PCC 7122]MBD2420606.1 UbiA family prenyltransferase [Anabaena cylindrica FACHB-243]MBY5282357.1 UbiA family prenyltransferase [Anabaena sp. CCAP 1446/1C]MBY5309232.1 UbiA family prenyltransferase [Anabaena sp. CCAP 1446/1C]MCM2408564.1 UbiA family prenyltransferase [Anabaena sp. CCAP 1446/1C]